MYKLKIANRAKSEVKRLPRSAKERYDNFTKELITTPKEGPYYTKYKGEHLTKVERDRKVKGFEVHSIEMYGRIRFVYEIHESQIEYNGATYEGLIHITDIANHEYLGVPYVRQFNGSDTSKTFSIKQEIKSIYT